MAPGDYLYVTPNRYFSPRAGEDPFEFICIVPLRGELVGMPIRVEMKPERVDANWTPVGRRVWGPSATAYLLRWEL